MYTHSPCPPPSLPSAIWRCFSQAVVFLYLMDEKTSLLVIIPAGIAAVIEVTTTISTLPPTTVHCSFHLQLWKVTKALKIEGIEWNGWRPRFKVSHSHPHHALLTSSPLHYLQYGECGADEVETGCYDGQAMQYLSYLLYPLVVAGAVYQLLYASYTR